MKIAMSSGHGAKCPGAKGIISEHEEAVRVVNRTAEFLRMVPGVEIQTFEEKQATDQNTNLANIVNWHNNVAFGGQSHDLDCFVHFNCNVSTSKPVGVECWYYSQKTLAENVASSIARESGLIDRGEKYSNGLYVLMHSEAPAVLPEICFVDSSADCAIYQDPKKFDAICSGLAQALCGEEVGPSPEPEPPEPVPPSDDRPMLQKGDKGPYVSELQQKIGVVEADGDFGGITDTWVRAFQGACKIGVDGKVGDQTWGQLDDLQRRVDIGGSPLPPQLVERICDMADESDIQGVEWPGRGMTPPGYIPGMALAFAYALRNDEADAVMGKAAGNPDKDCLAWYEQEFARLGMSNKIAGVDTLRHLFVMMIGLGPRESSARYCEGRDLSASNVASDTAEAGLFQTSWNIRSADPSIGPLLGKFWENPNGFQSQFRENVEATQDNLNSYGSGDGLRYQFLSRFCPLFHIMVTGIGMRTLRQHWGPINRREVTIKKEADDLLIDVQELIDAVA